MARIFTTPAAESAAKCWLHDITLVGGIRTNNQRSNGSIRPNPTLESHAQIVCKEVVERDFADIDSSIRHLSNYRYSVSLTGSGYKTFKPEAIAKNLVYLAEMANAYWDDTIRTPFEIEEFKKTLLGAAVWKYGRYISAIKDKTTKSASAAVGGTSNKAAGQPPKNNYKQSGPQSGNVRDLLGNPGDKVLANGNFIYKIVGDKTQSNTPNVFIKPLSASGATGNTNKVFFSSGNGYTDCTCYFDDENDAQDFLNKIIAAGRVPANISNPRVVKRNADPNGYFLAGTEFGVCAISAKTLNETLTEEANDSTGGWEKATEECTKEELEVLHTWMRRD